MICMVIRVIYNLALTISLMRSGIFFDTNAFNYISGTASYYDVIDKFFLQKYLKTKKKYKNFFMK